MIKALILNNTHSEFDFLKFLEKKYNIVYSVSNKKPYYLSKKIKHIYTDYRDEKKINLIIKNKKIKDAFPGANDLTLFTLSKLKNKFVDKFSTIRFIHNKIFFKKINKSIKYEKNLNLKKKIESLSYPMIAKPYIGHGGKGITKIDNKTQLHNLLKKKVNNYFIEQYIQGTNHGIFTLVENGKIIFNFFDTEQRYLNPFTVSSTISDCYIPTKIKRKIIKEISTIVKRLSLKNGIFHFQIIFNKQQKKYYILEATRRIPGDNYLKFINYTTGLKIEECIFDLYMHKLLKIEKKYIQNNFILRKIVMAPSNGLLNKVIISKKISHRVILKTVFKSKNYRIKNYLTERLGVIFFKFKSKKEMLEVTKNIDYYINVVVKKKK